MSNKKVITTLAYLINAGISSIRYYDNDSHPKLKDCKAYWDGDKLCFKINNKVYYLAVLESVVE